MRTLTLEEARRDFLAVAQGALAGEEVRITVGNEALCLVRDIPSRAPGYFAPCYLDPVEAAFEERICQDSKPVLEA